MGWFDKDIVTNINDVLRAQDSNVRAEGAERQFLLTFVSRMLFLAGIAIGGLLLFLVLFGSGGDKPVKTGTGGPPGT